MLLRSRFIVPMAAPSLENGAVSISGDRIQAVGAWPDLRPHVTGPVLDLGDVALLPGLINSHCHLDYTGFAEHLPPPRSFSAWIQGVLALKAEWSFSEYAASWIRGARQLLNSGCTTVLDIESVPELLPDAWGSTPLRVVSALEMTGVRAATDPAAVLARSLAIGDGLRHPRCRFALSPHAPYSTRAELLTRSAAAARDRGLLLTTHVAESIEEFRMFQDGEGAMYDWLKPQRDMSDCGGRTPLAHVAASGLLGPSTIVVHANYLEPADVELIAASGASVVHCPQSHDYFGHEPFPYRRLRAAGVPVCLGTDSLMTVRKAGRRVLELDLFDELRLFAANHPDTPAHELLALVTTQGARALGRSGELGTLVPGALADLVAVPIEGGLAGAAERILQHRGPVAGSMIGGVWATGPGGEMKA